MIHVRKKDDAIDVTCDGCSESDDVFEGLSFSTVVSELKQKGWRITKNGRGEWIHHCPDCAEGSGISRRRR